MIRHVGNWAMSRETKLRVVFHQNSPPDVGNRDKKKKN